MARPLDVSRFRAGLWDLGPSVDPDDPTEDDTRLALLSFAAQAIVSSQPGRRRSEWAAALGLSRGHFSERLKKPNRAFLSRLETEISAVSVRLRPQLTELHVELGLEPELEAQRPDLYDYLGPGRVVVGEVLLRGWEIFQRMLERRKADAHTDVLNERVGEMLDELFTLASSPFGASVLATQLAVEMGVRRPEPFFEALDHHLQCSPVSFRLARTVARLLGLFEQRKATITGADLERLVANEDTALTLLDQSFQNLPVRSDGPILDAYPGAEWTVELASKWLKLWPHDDLPSSRTAGYLRALVAEAGGASRELLHIHWATRPFHDRIPFGTAEAVRTSPWQSPTAVGIIDHLERHPQDPPPVPLDLLIPSSVLQTIDNALADIKTGVPPDIAGSLASLLSVALVTPNGVHRRRLIETIPAAGLVEPATTILTKVVRSTADVYVRESALFLISRLRLSSREVVQLLLASANDPVCAVARTACWALGDTFSGQSLDSDTFRPILDVLAGQATRDPSGNPTEDARIRVAATHALAIIAWELTGKDEFVVPAQRALHNCLGWASTTQAVGNTQVEGLARWGLKLAEATGIVPATQVGDEAASPAPAPPDEAPARASSSEVNP